MAPGGYRSPADEGLGNRSWTIGVRLLGGQCHRQRIALTVLDEGARQIRVGINDVGRVLSSAALVGDEGTFEVDTGKLISLGQLSKGLRPRTQHLSGSGYAGRNERGRPMTTMLEDCHEGCLGGLGVGEGLSTATVAVNIDEAGKVGRIAGLGHLALIVGNGTHTGNSRAVELDDSVLNNGVFQNQTATQHRNSHTHIVAHMTL